jgi:hypothetical protein
MRLFIDQYGNRIYAKTVRELREKRGGGRVGKMYVDRGDKTLHIGYVVGNQWFTEYAPVERAA